MASGIASARNSGGYYIWVSASVSNAFSADWRFHDDGKRNFPKQSAAVGTAHALAVVLFFSAGISSGNTGNFAGITASNGFLRFGTYDNGTNNLRSALQLDMFCTAGLSEDYLDFGFSKLLSQHGICVFVMPLSFSNYEYCRGIDLYLYIHSVCRYTNTDLAASGQVVRWIWNDLLGGSYIASSGYHCSNDRMSLFNNDTQVSLLILKRMKSSNKCQTGKEHMSQISNKRHKLSEISS